MVFAGTMGGHQYFTTPGGCTGSGCNLTSTDATYAWSSNTSTPVNATNEYYGGFNTGGNAVVIPNNSTYPAEQYCESLNSGTGYAGHTDWYLPAKMEFNLLYQNKVAINQIQSSGGFYTINTTTYYYWSSTEYNTTNAWLFPSNGYMITSLKTYNTYYVRCVRRY